ncbi:glycosyltransferase family 25 protein [Pontibaca methylaminivorans]|uniref:Glycosyl transferase, family 25 n=1 Tax=Pontibaca methylaminivorans TaxID=515897 RepID=A0A1R3WYW4_9RHOB|nr:glycosyltransferase family 25 protein [Pontibaca methylaminivorans]SIT83320.1 glycosyl transferase, family 25 [Pontibaca methylaminivorans]
MQTDWPIFVLTLEGDDDRRAELANTLERQGLSYELVMGVDGRAGLPAEYEKLVDRNAATESLGRPMTDGEFACALSHRAVYKRILDENLPGAIILEDDAILKPSFGDFVRARDYEKAPMILAYYAYGRAVRFTRRIVSQGTLHRAAVQCTMACAYTISQTAAGRLLKATTPVKSPADWPCSLYELDAWLMVPRLASHQIPGPQCTSHLEMQRGLLESRRAENSSTHRRSIREEFRRKLSVRVGRHRGER